MNDTTWYIHPGGCVTTNRLLAERLPQEDACPQKLCADGVLRDLWKCDHAVVTEFTRARKQLSLNFKVFVQEGQGPVRLWKFEEKKQATKV